MIKSMSNSCCFVSQKRSTLLVHWSVSSHPVVIFNKILMVQYNSTLGKYEGYTKKTVDFVDGLSKAKHFDEQAVKNKENCRTHMDLVSDLLSHPGKVN